MVLPQPVHYPQHLQREHILPQIVTDLQDDADVRARGVHVLEVQHERTHLAVHYSAFVGPNIRRISQYGNWNKIGTKNREKRLQINSIALRGIVFV